VTARALPSSHRQPRLPTDNSLKDNAVVSHFLAMPKVVIENPILNSPYDEPKRHFFFDEDGITDRTVNTRRISSYFVPIAKPKKKGKQLELETEWTADRIEENKFVNDIRRAVARCRLSTYAGITAPSTLVQLGPRIVKLVWKSHAETPPCVQKAKQRR